MDVREMTLPNGSNRTRMGTALPAKIGFGLGSCSGSVRAHDESLWRGADEIKGIAGHQGQDRFI